jgi:hypothetical protein
MSRDQNEDNVAYVGNTKRIANLYRKLEKYKFMVDI